MKNVFIIGSKGIPAKYGGFETFVEKLTENKKSKKIKYHVACIGENNEEFGGGERRLSRARLSAYPQIFPRHQTAHRRMVKPYKREPSGLFPFCAFSIEEEFEQDFTNR